MPIDSNKWTRLIATIGILGISGYIIYNKNPNQSSYKGESFEANGGSIGESPPDDDYNPHEEHSCNICARPYEWSRISRALVQHYLKESKNGTLGWKDKENPEGTRRTARNIAGFELYWFGLSALEHYLNEGSFSKLTPLVVELLRKAIVPNIIVGDVVQFIESLEIEDVEDLEPKYPPEFEEEFMAESFGAENEPKVFKVKWGFWYCNECGEEWDNKEDAENCYEEDFGGLVGEGDETPYQRYKKAVGLDAESFGADELSHDDKAIMIYEGIQQNLNNPEAVRYYYELFYGEPPADDYDGDMALDVIEAFQQNLNDKEFVDDMYGEMFEELGAESFGAEFCEGCGLPDDGKCDCTIDLEYCTTCDEEVGSKNLRKCECGGAVCKNCKCRMCGKTPIDYFGAESFEADVKKKEKNQSLDEYIPAGDYTITYKESPINLIWEGGLRWDFNDAWSDLLWDTLDINITKNKERFPLLAESQVFNQEHGDHDHEEIEVLMDKLDKLTQFCINYVHDGAYGGESQGVEVDEKTGITEEKILYIEGSVELKFINDVKGGNIAIRAQYTNDPLSPVIYMPATKSIMRMPTDPRGGTEDHDHHHAEGVYCALCGDTKGDVILHDPRLEGTEFLSSIWLCPQCHNKSIKKKKDLM